MKIGLITVWLIVALSFATGMYFYGDMPDRMASHWNAAGEVDGYMSKFWGTFMMPIISVVIALMFLFIPLIDPLKKNIQKFRAYFDGMIVFIIAFLYYIYVLSIVANLGYDINMTRYMMPALAALFYYMGILISHAKRNWFVGIRTPWTMSSDRVWDNTHRLGGKLFKAAGIIALFGMFFGDLAIYFVLVPVLGFTVYIFAYSYFDYKKTTR